MLFCFNYNNFNKDDETSFLHDPAPVCSSGPGLMYLRRDLQLPAWAVLVLMTSTVEIHRPLPGGVAVQTTWLTCTTCTACLQIRLQTLAGGNEQEDINFISSDSPTGQQTIEIRR